MKKEIMIGGVVIMAIAFAMGCGSKQQLGGNSSSTYNSMKLETKAPTVIVTETTKPVLTVETTSTPKPTKQPVVKKETAKTTQTAIKTTKPVKKVTKNVTATKTPSPAKTKKPTATKKPVQTKKPVKTPAAKATPKPTKKPEVKKTATPKPVKTPAPTKKPVKASVKNIKGMKPILTTVSLYLAEGQTYDASDEECYYVTMYMLANNVGYQFGKSQYKEKDGLLYIGRNAMQTLSAAAFADHSIIKNIPEDYADMITYNKEKQVYSAYASDAGDAAGKIKKSKDNGNGTYTVYFDLLSGDGKETIGSYEYTLVQMPSKYVKISPNFYYRIKDVKKLTE